MPLAALVFVLFFIFAPLVFLLVYYGRRKKINRDTQRVLSDRDLLRKIASQPDGLLSPHQLAAQTELSLAEARSRLEKLGSKGILTGGMDSRARKYYTLRQPLPEREPPTLSPDPFLTTEDLLLLLERNGFRLDFQELIMETGLPVQLIEREMTFFVKQRILKLINLVNGYGQSTTKNYILEEPYRSNPAALRERGAPLDLELREVLHNENLIV